MVGQVKQGKEDQRGAQCPLEPPPLLVARVGVVGPAAQLSDTVQAAVTGEEQREEEADGGAREGKGEALLGITK